MYAVEWGRGIEDAWTNVAEFVPKLLAFGLILLVGWLIAKALGKAFDAVLERVGFDDAVERGGIRKALEKSKYDASDIVGKVVYYALFLLVLQAAFGVFGQNPISDMINSVIAYLPKVFVAIVILVVAAAVAAGVKDIVQRPLTARHAASRGQPVAVPRRAQGLRTRWSATGTRWWVSNPVGSHTSPIVER